jgi:S-adenosyl-L-methionine hydrolase (adenosine-forming)
MSNPVSFLSDLAHTPEHIGVVHGVIARIDPVVPVIDITHEIRRGDIRSGALALLRTVQYMPDGVVLGYVMPTPAPLIAARTPVGYFVGPDNGLLAPAVAMVGGADVIVAIESEDFRIPSSGASLIVRDVAAPAAAALASGQAEITDLGPTRDPDSVNPLIIPLVEHANDSVIGEVLWVSGDGVAQCNVAPEDLVMVGISEGDDVIMRIGAVEHRIAWRREITQIEEGEGRIFVDPFGQIAVDVRGGSAAESYPLGERVAMTFLKADGGTPVSLSGLLRSSE